MAGVHSSHNWQENQQTEQHRPNRIWMSPLEWALLAAMLLTVTVSSLDALEGRAIGKNDALAMAKLRGQQELMASNNK